MHSVVPLDPEVCAAIVASKRWQRHVIPGPGNCIDWATPNSEGRAGALRVGNRNPMAYRVAWVDASCRRSSI